MLERRRHLRPGERVAALLAAAMALALNVAATVQLFAAPTTFGYHLVYTDGNRVKTVDPKPPPDALEFCPATSSTLPSRLCTIGLWDSNISRRASAKASGSRSSAAARRRARLRCTRYRFRQPRRDARGFLW